jgi:hypothetical protein
MSEEKKSILPQVGEVRFTEERGWETYLNKNGVEWCPVPMIDVPVEELLMKWEDLVMELSEKEIVATMREIRELTATKHFDDAISMSTELLSQLPKNSARVNEVRILLEKAKEKKQNKNINNKSQKNGKI